MASLLSGIKTAVKYTNPFVFAGDVLKDRVESTGFGDSPAQVTYNQPARTAPAITQSQDPYGPGGLYEGQVLGANTTSPTGTRTTAPTIDWSSIAEANDLIAQSQDQLNRLPGQEAIFNQNLNNTYSKYRSDLQQGYDRTQGTYQDNKLQNSRAQERTLQQIRSGAGQQMNALSRYLNSIGAGDTMAARGMVPYGVARQAQRMQGDANNVYGGNDSNMDKSWNQYQTDYQGSLADLMSQENNARKKFQQDQLTAQLTANDNLRRGQSALQYAQTGDAAQARATREAGLAEMFRIKQLIDQLGLQDVSATVKDPTYNAPDAEQYAYQDGQNAPGVDPSTASDTSPWLQYLMQMNKEDENIFGY